MTQDTLTDDALAAIRARVEATSGEMWYWHHAVEKNGEVVGYRGLDTFAMNPVIAWQEGEWLAVNPADAWFIAAAPDDIRALLNEVEALRARLAACEGNVTDKTFLGDERHGQ